MRVGWTPRTFVFGRFGCLRCSLMFLFFALLVLLFRVLVLGLVTVFSRLG